MAFGGPFSCGFARTVHRRAKRTPVDLPAMLLMAGLPAAACRIRNISLTGALIEFQSTRGIANQVMLTFANRSRWVRVVWSEATRIGVKFI